MSATVVFEQEIFLGIVGDINIDIKIFSLSILLSSVFIYNS